MIDRDVEREREAERETGVGDRGRETEGGGGAAFQPPFPCIHPTCQSDAGSVLSSEGVIFWQLSCHTLENVNECVCKIKFMGCQ